MILFLVQIALAESLILSYDDALKQALKNNPDIKLTTLEVKKSQSGLMEARGIFDPRINASIGRNYRTQQQFFAGLGTFNSEVYGPSYTIGMQAYSPTGTNISLDWTTSRNTSVFQSQDIEGIEQEISPIDTTMTMTLTQSLLQGYRFQFNMQPVREAQRSLSISELIAIETQQESLAQTATAYWNAIYQSKLLLLAEESVKIAQEEQRVVKAKVEQGDLASVEADRVEAATLASKSALIDAENAYISACESLLLLLGEEPDKTIEFTTIPETDLDQMHDLDKELQMVLANNPTLQRLRLLVTAAEERVREAQHANLPELNATMRYSYTGWEDEFNDSFNEMIQGGLPGRYIGLNIDVPIANWSDKGAYEQRVIDLTKARQDFDNMERTISQQVRTQVRDLHSTQAKAKLAEVNLRVAEKNLESDRALRDAGRSIEKDVLDSIKAVEDARAQYEKALADHQLAKVSLLKLQGAM
jgi:outer membrane protein TolC